MKEIDPVGGGGRRRFPPGSANDNLPLILQKIIGSIFHELFLKMLNKLAGKLKYNTGFRLFRRLF